MNSSYYLNMKNKYESIRGKLQSVFSYFDACSANITKTSSYLKNLKLDEKEFDDGKLNENLSNLCAARDGIQAIINECNSKIHEYNNLYNQARRAELNAKKSEDNSISKDSL